jgi:hypothetical protein
MSYPYMEGTAGMEGIDAPLGTFRADVEGAGTCHLPDAFEGDYVRMTAALDWARVHSYSQDADAMYRLSQELAAATRHAEAIAAMCRDFAASADALRTAA